MKQHYYEKAIFIFVFSLHKYILSYLVFLVLAGDFYYGSVSLFRQEKWTERENSVCTQGPGTALGPLEQNHTKAGLAHWVKGPRTSFRSNTNQCQTHRNILAQIIGFSGHFLYVIKANNHPADLKNFPKAS